MPTATFNGEVIASSKDFETVEGNIYFPPSALKREFFKKSDHTTTCPWKGEASYFDVIVNGKISENGAWYYPDPKKEAKNIHGYIAFWNGVEVQK